MSTYAWIKFVSVIEQRWIIGRRSFVSWENKWKLWIFRKLQWKNLHRVFGFLFVGNLKMQRHRQNKFLFRNCRICWKHTFNKRLVRILCGHCSWNDFTKSLWISRIIVTFVSNFCTKILNLQFIISSILQSYNLLILNLQFIILNKYIQCYITIKWTIPIYCSKEYIECSFNIKVI